MEKNHEHFIQKAIELAEKGMNKNAGGPFGCVVVKDDEIIAEGFNQVTTDNDPTAHAEVVAIRKACENLQNFQLENCIIYTSCEPCPMCLGAIYWSRPKAVYYACTKEDAAEIDFDDQFIYDEIDKDISSRSIEFINIEREKGVEVFKQWKVKADKTAY
ncbi:MAG: nucleoside deaminase [Psychroflexus halocasei]|uniref:nucleoside deaminase n=1 Tax=Psychroflexus sp. S27 TaxID=1982757 RepID=UPI000C2A1A32|nr:nucleoside deaminase [Psychroflexus sp. S27]PJX28431.1 tRNA-specific adenosine deaminase [Psychroflexus sp. S27]